MSWTLVRYRVKPEEADENARLISSVFAELQSKAPQGLHYGVIRVQDDTFVHIVSRENGALSPADLVAFKQFQTGIHDRCLELPVVLGAAVVGNYQMFDPERPAIL
jgi:hypothetical protein